MKAVEWAAKFQAATTPEATDKLLEEFGDELTDLIVVRTKTSTDKTRQAAAQGAINEGRSKFNALIGRVPALNMGMYDLQVVRVASRYIPKAKQAQEEKEIENTDGRTLVKQSGGNPTPPQKKESPQRNHKPFQRRDRFGGPRPQKNDQQT